MTQQIRAFARRALWALPVWAALLFLSTLTHQLDAQTDFPGFAKYVTTSQFLISHLVGSILGAAIGSIGVIGLMLYLQDSKAAGRAIAGMAITASGRFPRWTGWVYAVSSVGFVLSNFLLPVAQSVFSALLIITTVAVAWVAAREDRRSYAKAGVSPET